MYSLTYSGFVLVFVCYFRRRDEVMFLPATFVCLFVCLSVRSLDHSKSCERILMKIFVRLTLRLRLDFGGEIRSTNFSKRILIYCRDSSEMEILGGGLNSLSAF